MFITNKHNASNSKGKSVGPDYVFLLMLESQVMRKWLLLGSLTHLLAHRRPALLGSPLLFVSFQNINSSKTFPCKSTNFPKFQ